MRRRLAAIESIGYIGGEIESAVPALVEMLPRKSEGPSAVQALANMGSFAKDAIPALFEHHHIHHYGSGAALAGIGNPAFQFIRYDLRSGDPKRQQRGLGAIWYMVPHAAEFLPDLKNALGSGDARVQYNALVKISRLGDTKREAAPEVAKLLTDKNEDLGFLAASVLLEIDPENENAREFMIKTLGDRKRCWWAMDALRKIGPRAKGAIPALTRALDSDNPRERINAAVALGCIAPGSYRPMEVLLRGMSDADPEIRQVTAICIEGMGDSGKPLYDELRKSCADANRSVAYYAARAIIQLNPNDVAAAEVFLEFLRSYDGSGFGTGPAIYLRRADSSHGTAAPLLVKCLKDDVNVRGQFPSLPIAISLWIMDPESQFARQILRRAIRDRRQRSYAIHALGDAPLIAHELAPELTDLLRDPNFLIRSGAAELLAKAKRADLERTQRMHAASSPPTH